MGEKKREEREKAREFGALRRRRREGASSWEEGRQVSPGGGGWTSHSLLDFFRPRCSLSTVSSAHFSFFFGFFLGTSVSRTDSAPERTERLSSPG